MHRFAVALVSRGGSLDLTLTPRGPQAEQGHEGRKARQEANNTDRDQQHDGNSNGSFVARAMEQAVVQRLNVCQERG
jgi:hypothetical protein